MDGVDPYQIRFGSTDEKRGIIHEVDQMWLDYHMTNEVNVSTYPTR